MKKLLFSSLALSAIVIGLAGCLKDKGFEEYKYGINDPDNSPVAVGFPEAANAINNRSIEAIATAQTLADPVVALFGGDPAPQDIHVTLALDTSLVGAYNAAHPGTNLQKMATTQYAIPNFVVTIPKGQRNGHININFPNASTIDPLFSYGFGFKIVSVQESGYKIAANNSKILYQVSIKNKYDGIYRVRGYKPTESGYDAANPTGFKDITNALFTSTLPHTVYLITSGPASVTVYRVINGALTVGYLFSNNGAGTYYGNFGAKMTFDLATDKLISVVNDYGQGTGNRFAFIDPTGVNKFFASDHHIEAKYTMNQPTATTQRTFFNEYYEYIGPR